MLLLVALTLLHGTVTVGPTSPVCRVDQPCSKPAGNVTLTFVRGGFTTRRVTTDEAGRYKVSLPAGAWTVRSRIGIGTQTKTFLVPRVATAVRNFSFDTGIR